MKGQFGSVAEILPTVCSQWPPRWMGCGPNVYTEGKKEISVKLQGVRKAWTPSVEWFLFIQTILYTFTIHGINTCIYNAGGKKYSR